MPRSLQGNCLLASPFMEDPNFYRAVVYLVRHNDDHAFGLILNRPTDFTLEKVVSIVCDLKCSHRGPLYCGGPVDGPLVALHDCPEIGGEECVDGLKLCGNQDELKKLFVIPDARLKLFDGFAGWGPGQLEDELETGSWLVSDIDADLVLSDDTDIWENLVRRIGQNILASDDKISDCPIDPQWN
ncbi:MAG: YqgE/AlgH family protein [Pirellula sp.]